MTVLCWCIFCLSEDNFVCDKGNFKEPWGIALQSPHVSIGDFFDPQTLDWRFRAGRFLLDQAGRIIVKVDTSFSWPLKKPWILVNASNVFKSGSLFQQFDSDTDGYLQGPELDQLRLSLVLMAGDNATNALQLVTKRSRIARSQVFLFNLTMNTSIKY